MSLNPKTPTHRGRPATTASTRNENMNAAGPLTPTNNIRRNASPTKQSQPTRMLHKPSRSESLAADTSNPFLVRTTSRSTGLTKSGTSTSNIASSASRTRRGTGTTDAEKPPSPVKRSTSTGPLVNASLRRQASAGVIRRNGPESRMDVVSMDYVPPPSASASTSLLDEKNGNGTMKRSRSTPGHPRSTTPGLPNPPPSSSTGGDRFISTQNTADDLTSRLDTLSLSEADAATSSPGHTARLAQATGLALPGSGRRVLAFHIAPPSARDPLLTQARAHAAGAHAAPPSSSQTSKGAAARSRAFPSSAERVLDAPGMLDDFYLNVLSWSRSNLLAVGLSETVYIWDASSGSVNALAEAPEGSFVTSVQFSGDGGGFLGVGMGTGAVELWDVEKGKRLRTMGGHQAQVASLSWNGHILSSGCHDGSIWHHDVRVSQHKVGVLEGHSGEVCGLTWRADGQMLASGGNDNVVNIWDARWSEGAVNEDEVQRMPKWTKRNHTAAVKALAWCPWQPSLLASGGGTNDASIHIFNSTTGARTHTLTTPAQVTSLIWSPHSKQLLSTHGYPTHALMLHTFPALQCIGETRDAHDQRILHGVLGPDGEVVCTGAGDENLKFWRVWETPKKEVTRGKKKEGKTDAGVLGIR